MLALPVFTVRSRIKPELHEPRNVWLAAIVAQLPLLHATLCLAVLTMALGFVKSISPSVSLGAPTALFVAAAWRATASARRGGADAAPGLWRLWGHGLIAVAGLLAGGWTLSIYIQGGVLEREQLLYAVTIIDIICIFSLVQAPKAAALVGGLSLPAFLLVYGLNDTPSAPVVTANFVLIGALFAAMLTTSARDIEAISAAQRRAQALAEENLRLANTDCLTGLSNRRDFFVSMERMMARTEEGGAMVMGLIDLDGFKPVNDVYGHAVGDQVLHACAARLAAFAEDGVTIARLGGDEFGILLPGAFEEGDLLALGARICAALKAPIQIGEVQAGVSSSIGFARYPTDAIDGRQLYERADYALYFCKQNHRGEAVLFTPQHQDQMQLAAKVEQSLRKADFDREFSVEFQPLFNVHDGSVIAFEALARWNSPELGPIPPNVFVPVAERSEIIHLMTRTVLRKALRAAVGWPEAISLGFNMSVRDLLSRSALMQIVAIIETSGVDPARLDIEVTETALISDFERAEDAIRILKRLGVKVCLDDFGAGYSSLAYIHRLPLDKIKIDRSFVQEISGNGPARDILKTMIRLCGHLNLHCVTEGVETTQQYELLRSYGCDVVQGFLFSRPIAEEDVPRFIEEASRSSEMEKRRA